MNTKNLLEIFKNLFDPDECTEFLREIHNNDRLFSFDAFERTAYNCYEFMKDSGLENVEMLPVKADGKTPYGDWVIPQAWNAEYGVLKSIDNTVLADYNQVPCSLVMYSGATPDGGITAEAVIVDDNFDVDVKGKIIVTTKSVGQLVDYAVENGAIGIVTDFIPLYKGVRDDVSNMRDVSRWDNSSFAASNKGLFGFSLSPDNGEKLRELIREGKSTLHAEVKTKRYDGVCYTVSGKIKGESENSINIYGHLYEPGANDNSSGCAVILELARCINEAINDGVLQRPRLTLNFVMGWECTGSIAWFEAKERHSVGGFVADMVGTDTIDNSHMCIWHAPMSNISFADYYIENIIETYINSYGVNFKWENKKFSIGTDNLLSDPCFSMPSAAMITEPAFSYHSSLDVASRIQRDVIARNGVIIGVYLFGLAVMKLDEVDEFWQAIAEYINKMSFAYKFELLKNARQSLKKLFPEWSKDGDLIPVRKVAGCLTFDARADLSNSEWQPAWNNQLNLPLFWADSKRSLWEITVLSAAEYGESFDIQWKLVRDYFMFLEKNDYISLI
jgi:Uncharacterized protein conserved in bacteria with an aminopeptidase-like domain